jgi:hypothetical protein
MFNNGAGSITKLTQEDDKPFDLFAIDLAEPDSPPPEVHHRKG